MAAVIREEYREIPGGNTCDHCRISCTACTAVRPTVYAVAAEKRYGVPNLTADLSESQSNLGYVVNCFNSKTTARNAYRKKYNSNSKSAKESTHKVFSEELFGNLCRDELASSTQTSRDNVRNEASSSVKFVKCNSSCTVRPSISCIHLEKHSQTSIITSSQLPSPSFEISDVNNKHPRCHVCNLKLFASTNCELQPSECCNGKHGLVQCPSFNNDGLIRGNNGGHINQDIKRAQNNLQNVRRQDQSRLTWKRCQKLRSKKSKRDTVLPLDHVNHDSSLQIVGCPISQTSVAIDELSFVPYHSAKNISGVSASNPLDADEDISRRGVHRDVSIEFLAHIPEQRLSSEIFYSSYHTERLGLIHSAEYDRSHTSMTNFAKAEHNSWSALRGQGSKLDRHQYHSISSQTELLQQHLPCEAKIYSEDRGTFDVIQQCEWMKFLGLKSIDDKKVHHIVNENGRNTSYSNSSITSRIRRGQNFPHKPRSGKWIPVCKKKVKIPKSMISDVVCDNMGDHSPMRKNNSILQGDVISPFVPDAPSDPQSENLLSSPEVASLMERASEIEGSNYKDKYLKVQHVKDYYQPFPMPKCFTHLVISAQVVEKAFISSYRFRMASRALNRELAIVLQSLKNYSVLPPQLLLLQIFLGNVMAASIISCISPQCTERRDPKYH